MQVIARLGSLQTVNATPVTAYERKDSELRYMRSVLGMQSLCADFQRAWTSSRVAYNACLGSHAPSETRFPLLCAGQLRSLSGSAVQELREKHPRLQELQERWAAFLCDPLQEL